MAETLADAAAGRRARVAAWSRAKRQRRRERGLCEKCGVGAPRAGKGSCAPCGDADRARLKALRDSRKAKGLCPLCEAPASAGLVMCSGCHADAKKSGAEHHARRRAAGLCQRCRKPVVEGGVYCESHTAMARGRNLRTNYGIGHAEFDALLAAQGGGCAICGSVSPSKGRGAHAQWHVDHDHSTGAVRGVLCGKCNCMLGFAADDAERLRAGAAYIERHAVREAA